MSASDRAQENARLRAALELWCPLIHEHETDETGRRACRDGEHELCDILDRALRGLPILPPSVAELEPKALHWTADSEMLAGVWGC